MSANGVTGTTPGVANGVDMPDSDPEHSAITAKLTRLLAPGNNAELAQDLLDHIEAYSARLDAPAVASPRSTLAELLKVLDEHRRRSVSGAETARALRSILDKARATAGPPSPADLCNTFPGMFRRIPTGLPTLDKATGGGLQTSRLHFIGAPPGHHKTSLISSWGYSWARRGVSVLGLHREVLVVIFATDEPRHGFLSRIAQIEGACRADLDSEDLRISSTAWNFASERLRDVPNLVIFDPRFDRGMTFDDVAEFAAARAGDRRAAVLVDSLHSAPFRSDFRDQDPRQKIESRVKAAVNLAVKHRLCILGTSELNRNSYRNKNRDDDQNDLAAFKEASGIEYGADLAWLLRRSTDDPRLVDVAVCKNRLGPDVDFTFRIQQGTQLNYTETVIPEKVDPGAEKMRDDILTLIRNKDIKSANEVCDNIKGTRRAILEQVKYLKDNELIRTVSGRFRVVVELTDETR